MIFVVFNNNMNLFFLWYQFKKLLTYFNTDICHMLININFINLFFERYQFKKQLLIDFNTNFNICRFQIVKNANKYQQPKHLSVFIF